MHDAGKATPTVDQFVHCYHDRVRWGDIDSFGHVNNVMFFRYLEGARMTYSRDLVGREMRSVGESLILADQRCSFVQQLTWPGELDVYTRTVRVGRSSFDLQQIICRAGETGVAAVGYGVIVWFDFGAQRSARIPDTVRQRIAAYERVRPEGL